MPPLADDADGPAIWRHVLDAAPRMTRPLIEHMEVVSFDGKTLRLHMCPEGAPHLKWFRNDPAKLTSIVQDLTKRRITAALELDQIEALPSGGSPPPDALVERVRASEAVRAAMELFDARIVSVTPIANAAAAREQEQHV
jgi:hypothetical protein